MAASIKCPYCKEEISLVPMVTLPPKLIGEDPNTARLRQLLVEQEKRYQEAQKQQSLPQWLRIGEVT